MEYLSDRWRKTEREREQETASWKLGHCLVKMCAMSYVCVSGFLWPPQATVPLLPWKPGSGLTWGTQHCEPSMRAQTLNMPNCGPHTHIHTKERINRLDASIIYQFLTHIPSLSLNVCKHGHTPAHTYVVTAPHLHTPTEVAWIITFTARLLGNSKPTCQCIVCLCVYFPVKLSKSNTVDRTLFPSNYRDSVHTQTHPETGFWFRGQNSLQCQKIWM